MKKFQKPLIDSVNAIYGENTDVGWYKVSEELAPHYQSIVPDIDDVVDHIDYVKNLIGIDICDRPGVDIVSDFTELDFEDNSIDAIIAYGSINFGDEDLIEKQLIEAKRVLRKDGIICFRGYSSKDPFYYYWTKEKCIYFTEKLGLDLINEPEIVNRLNRKGEAKSTWRDKMYEKLHNKDKTKRRDLTRLHWRWKK